MRRSSTSLLLAGTLAASVALLNCASPSGDDADGTSADNAAISGIPNEIGLRLVYDTRSSTVRGTVKRPLTDHEILRLQVRRGRLSAQSQYELDCNKLPVAPPTKASKTVAGDVYAAIFEPPVVYQGPVVEPSLLATVYDQRWILAHVSPEQLEELQTQGADSIVEACVMNGLEIKSRVQTTIAYAWDDSDPLLAGHSLVQTGARTASVNPGSE